MASIAIQQVIDKRPSDLSSTPTFATGASDSISDPTKRINFQNNDYLPRTYAPFPQDVNLPTPGFFWALGFVRFRNHSLDSGNVHHVQNAARSTDRWAVNQIFVSASGAQTCQVTATPGTSPAAVLPIAGVTVDSVSLIRNNFD